MTKRIMPLGSYAEALRIKDILDGNDIPHIIRTFHDSAYDGLFQNHLGWGVLEADEKDESRIFELLQEAEKGEDQAYENDKEGSSDISED
jgi:hypothetical protein